MAWWHLLGVIWWQGEGTAAWWDPNGVVALSHKKSNWEEVLWPSPAWEMMSPVSHHNPKTEQTPSCCQAYPELLFQNSNALSARFCRLKGSQVRSYI